MGSKAGEPANKNQKELSSWLKGIIFDYQKLISTAVALKLH